MSSPSAIPDVVRFLPSHGLDRALVGRLVIAAVALLAIGGGVAMSLASEGARPAWGWILGAAMGAVFVAAGLSFAAGARQALVEGRTHHLRAQLLMVAVAAALFAPALAAGSVFGLPVRGYVFPVGVALVAGAVLFGMGMQIAGACATGTLAAVGSGSAKLALALVSMVAGATVAALFSEHWTGLPRLAPMGFADGLGVVPGIAVTLGLVGALWFGLGVLERSRRGSTRPLFQPLAPGNLSLGTGAILVGVLAFATLVALGRPWSVSAPFAFWGSRGIEGLGLDDPTFWPFWEDPTRVDLFQRAILADPSTTMNLGMVLGALLAAGLMARVASGWRVAFRPALGAILGGFAMGAGAMMATGCNIGAFLAGAASGSAHGWVWLVAALLGNAIGIGLRPLFGLSRAG